MEKTNCRHFCILSNRCFSFYDSMFSLTGWNTFEINNIEFDLNSILFDEWKGKPYRLSYKDTETDSFLKNLPFCSNCHDSF